MILHQMLLPGPRILEMRYIVVKVNPPDPSAFKVFQGYGHNVKRGNYGEYDGIEQFSSTSTTDAAFDYSWQ